MSLIWPILRHGIFSPFSPAIVDDQRTYTYGKLAAGAFYLADQIEARTTRRHVGVMLPTSGLFPMAILGTWLLGRVAVPLNYLLSPEELQHVIRDSDIDAIITVGPMLEFIGGQEVIPPDIDLIRLEEVDFHSFPTPRWPASPDDEDLAVILYTSGTSGLPKGVMLTHRNLQSNIRAAIEHAGLTHSDGFLGVLPQFHSFGLTALTLLPLAIGAKVVYTARFVPRRIIELIRQHKPDIFMAVPSMYGALLSAKNATSDDFASLRIMISGGEPLPQSVYDACSERFGRQLLEGYGLTETSPVVTWATLDRNRLHSVGQTLPGVEVYALDDDGNVLGPNRDGELIVTGPNIMKGYYKQPHLTDEVIFPFVPPGQVEPVRAFRTGDIGHVDEAGYVFITGRKKEMLIIGGENVSPREIEEVLNRHDAIHASAVVGKADGMRGEVPIAFVELEENASIDGNEVRQFCRQYLAQYKVPREVHVLDQLPRNPTGKVLRRKLVVDH